MNRNDRVLLDHNETLWRMLREWAMPNDKHSREKVNELMLKASNALAYTTGYALGLSSKGEKNNGQT